MRVDGAYNYIDAVFIRELKNRFLCEVELNGERVTCYVPSSCHLSHFIRLDGKRVLLVPTITKSSKTKYALFAVPYKSSYILLNTSMANCVIENSIHSRRFACLGKRKTVIKEHYIGKYKSDLYIEDTNTIIEIKSVLSTSKIAMFPTVYSERTVRQLQEISLMLNENYNAFFVIISLNPYVKVIYVNSQSDFYKSLATCIDKGLKLQAFSCKLASDGQVYINGKLPILFK